MPTDEPPPVDLDEAERLLWAMVDIASARRRLDMSDWCFNNLDAVFARLRYLETELARMKGKEGKP